jgi:endoglucanase
MELMKNIELLSALPGVSGGEDAVRVEILGQLAGVATECRVDALGNIIAFKKGKKAPGQRLLFSAHMDEVGFIVTHIEDSGLLRFTTVGGIDSRVVVGKAVEVGDKRVYGVIGQKATHQANDKERDTPPKTEELYIDIGADNRGDAEAMAAPGDRVIFHSEFTRLGGGKLMGRAFDDRAGCALLLSVLHSELEYDCYFAFTVQEETGCTGATAAGFSVEPGISVVVETTTASDIAGVSPDKVVCKLGAGPVVSYMDKGTIYDRGLYKLARETAAAHDIPNQTKEGVYGGNEARSIQVSRSGVRMLAVSIPCRYLHSPSVVMQESDVLHTEVLLERLVGVFGELK